MTSRAHTFLVAAFVLYLFANQTQVGWLYVMSALLAGTVVAAGALSQGALRRLEATRRIGTGASEDYHEGDQIDISLRLENRGRAGISQLRVTEHCLLAAPESDRRKLELFIPSLPGHSTVAFDYQVTLDRRGLHEFPPLQLKTSAPFGFFRQARSLPLSTRVLVYPEVCPLKRLQLLDNRLSPQVARARAGAGSDILGVRPYRSGDSPRHIHWRSVARTGELVTKEFEDETQPGVTLLLDLYAHPYPDGVSKHVPFEWGVKATASIGDYARSKGYPLSLLADPDALALPGGTVAWSALMQYLARVEPTGQRRLSEVAYGQGTQALIAAILPWPDEACVEALLSLRTRGLTVLAVILDPPSFPAGGPSAKAMANTLAAGGVDVRLLEFGHDLAAQLDESIGVRL